MKRKPHSDFAGYVCELRNPHSGGHTIILDCKRAELVLDYKAEGGRYQVLCNEHSTIVHCTALTDARGCMKDPTIFCQECRILAGESTRESERLLPESTDLVRLLERVIQYLEHPDVAAIPFALPSATVANQCRTAIKDLNGH